MKVKSQKKINPVRIKKIKNKIKKRIVLSTTLILFFNLKLEAGPLEQAKRIHERLAGVPPSETTLIDMADAITRGDVESAAFLAMNNPAFYNVTLKNWATPWTNREFDVFQPLNDYSATVIGLVRDQADFRQLLFEDLVYTGTERAGVPPYSNTDNQHYEELEAQNVDLSDPLNFTSRVQSSLVGLPASATAGVMTSRAAAQAFFILGTNRAMFRFTLLNHLCHDLEQVADTSLSPDRIRQDVSRSPGGDSRAFLNGCIGCHSGMDPMAQAFAYYDFTFDSDSDPNGDRGRIQFNGPGEIEPQTGSRVVPKYQINSATFPFGFVTPDDSWDNRWRLGQNRVLGWSDALPGRGNGAKSLGRELANSQAFAQCQVEKAFELVCLRPPSNSEDRDQIQQMTQSFQSDSYNMKRVFANAANYCKGD